ncbi:transporter-domain-containing protein [Tuber indicum]|nr:transporter-domain-containing protein [Tuber indicum]
MAGERTVGELTTPYGNAVGDGCSESRASGAGGGDITPANTFEMSQYSHTASLSSCAPLSKDQQYIRTVAHVDFTKALLAQKPSPWTKSMLKLYCYLFVAFLNSCINGYDGSIMGGINAMSTYQRYFNMKTTGSSTGVVFAIYSIGHFLGCFICGPLSDSWGRRWGMFSGALTVIIGTCVQALSTTHASFMGGRFILGLGAAILTTAGPVYVAEMAHPAWRGTITGLYNTFYCVGGLAATWTMYRTQYWDSDLSWRLPIWLQSVASGTVLLLCLWCPETPRWLVSNDRNEEAIRVLATYHGDGNRKSPIVLLSYKEMLEEIVLSGSDKRWWDYSELFKSTNAKWRMVCVAGMAFFGQWSGNGAVTHFLPVLLDNVGIRSETTQLFHNATLTAVSFGAAIVGCVLVDRVGRRVVLMTGTGLFVAWWTVITILTSYFGKESNTNTAGSTATIAFIYLFGVTYSVSYTPLQALYPVECLKYETRAKGMGVFAFFTNIATLFNSYGIAVFIGKTSWGFCFLYIAWDILELIVIYLFFVETRARTLEEINEIFKDPMPRNKSLQKHSIIVTESGILYQGLIGDQQNLESPPLPPSEQKF